jgi:predicted dienelactone hydrolase
LVISPTHAGSDTASIAFRTQPPSQTGPKRETLMQSINDPDNLRNRPRDISFVIDELFRRSDLSKIADLNHIGVAGHSFGAFTAMAIGGMLVDLSEGKKQSLRDPRVKAVLPMSPEGPGTMGISPGAWDQFAVPVLFFTGTKDYGVTERSATWRDDPFKSIHTVPEWMVTIVDGTHMTFAIPGSSSPLIRSVGTAFFDAKVLDDPKAVEWMNGFFAAKHDDCIVDHKE